MRAEDGKDGGNLTSNETDGFKFAVTLLAAFGTISYTAYDYLQHTAVDNNWYSFFCGIIPVALILVFGLLSYILIKGISLEVRNHIKSEHLKKWASYIYLATFLMCITVLVFFLCIFLWVVVLDHENSISISLLILIVSILSAFILYRPETVSQIKKIIQTRKTFNYVRDLLRDLQNILTIPFALAIMITISLIIWLIVFQPVLHSPLQGHVTVDMDSICYKDGAPIPVLIQVTGPNNGLSIYLSREEAENNLTQIDLINYLKPEHSGKRMVSGNNNSILSGNSLGGGRYSVFINTTNLTREYYEIKSVRPKYTKKYGLKGFYLLNNS